MVKKNMQEETQLVVRKYIRNIVYGGLNGITTTFTVIAGAFGAAFLDEVLLILGLASLFGNAISVGLSDFFGARSEHETKERYMKETKSYHRKCQVDAAIKSLFGVFSFLLFGSMPLFTYLIAPFYDWHYLQRFFIACILTGVTLFILGAARVFVTRKFWLTAGLEILSIGCLSGVVAYYIGRLATYFIG